MGTALAFEGCVRVEASRMLYIPSRFGPVAFPMEGSRTSTSNRG